MMDPLSYSAQERARLKRQRQQVGNNSQEAARSAAEMREEIDRQRADAAKPDYLGITKEIAGSS